MWKTLAIAGLGLALTMSPALAQSTPPSNSNAAAAEQTDQLTPGWPACAFCITCGGPWPYVTGEFYYSASPGRVWGRGYSCSAPWGTRTDYSPRLCCGLDYQ